MVLELPAERVHQQLLGQRLHELVGPGEQCFGQRNRAIRNFILNTDSFEFITFAPTEVIGLDGGAQPGDTFTFQLAGELTIRDVTQPVVFEVTATVDSVNQLSGTAVTTVQRSDYNLAIPSVPQVADVSEEVRVELDFVAAGT